MAESHGTPPIQTWINPSDSLSSAKFFSLQVCSAPTSLTHCFTPSYHLRERQEAPNSGSAAVSLALTQDNPRKMQTEAWLSLLPEGLNTSLGF